MSSRPSLTAHQLHQLNIAARVSAVISLCGACITITSYLSCSALRKPFNRLAFVIATANAFGCAAYTWAVDPAHAGASPWCQAQGFMIQWFVMADPFIVLVMALSVWLHIEARRSHKEIRVFENCGITAAFVLPFGPALAFLIWRPGGEIIYARAGAWCWISEKHNLLRLYAFYVPIWTMILSSLVLFVLGGRRILRIRAEVVSSQRVRNEIFDSGRRRQSWAGKPLQFLKPAHTRFLSLSGSSSSPEADQNKSEGQELSVVMTPPQSHEESIPRRPRSIRTRFHAMHWKYARFAFLCALVLLVTWIPISINRVYNNIIHQHDRPVFGLYFASAICIPLHGFGNFLVYANTSWSECRAWVGSLWSRTLQQARTRHRDEPA